MEPWGVVVKAALPWVKKKIQGWKLDHDIEAVFHQAFTGAPEAVAVLCEKSPPFIGQIMALAQGKTPDLDLMLEAAAACHTQYQYAEFAPPQVIHDLKVFSRNLNNQWREKAGPKSGELPLGYSFFYLDLSYRQDGQHAGPATAQEPPRPNSPPIHIPHRRNFQLRHFRSWQEKIQLKINTNNQVAIAQGDAALGGEGGIGKTAMAVEYAYAHVEDSPGGIFWLQADLGLAQALGKVAEAMKWPLPAQANDQIITGLVLQEMRKVPGRKLIILDNLEDPDLVKAFASLHDACLLVTTRQKKVRLPYVDMDLPPEEEALGIFLAYANLEGKVLSPSQQGAAYEICQSVGFLPLALEIMGNLACTQALPDLAHGLVGQIALVEREGQTHTKDLTSVAAALGLADQRYSHPRAREALVYLGYLHPENLDAELLGLVMLAEPDKENDWGRINGEAKEMLASLADCSVVRVKDEGGYTMHRLVQEAARLMDQGREVGARVVDRLDDIIIAASEKGAYRDAYHLIPHLTHLAGLDSGAEDEEAFPNAHALLRLAKYLIDSGHYAPCESIVRALLARVEQVKGKEHPDYATHLNNLAFVLDDQGKVAEAEELYRQALDIGEKTIGKEHPSYAIRLNNLALVLKTQGKLAEAEKLYRQALAIDEKTIGKEHPGYATDLNNLAGVLRAQGKLQEAEDFYRQALAIDEKTIGKEHPEYAKHLNNLAGVLDDQGKVAEAEELYRQALAIDEKAIGKEHPSYAIRLNNLAGVLRAQGKLQEAEKLCRQALAIDERTIGKEHPAYAMHLHNLGVVLKDQGKLEKAEELYCQAIAISLNALGPEHPETKILQRNLALLLAAMRKRK